MSSEVLKDDLKKIWPIIEKSPSDSATFDNALELLVMSGYSLPHAMMLMIPEAWKDNPLMDPKRKSFYEYYSALIEPMGSCPSKIIGSRKNFKSSLL